MTSVKEMNKLIKKMEEKRNDDPVNYPAHYNKGGIGCIDAIKAATGDGYKYYIQGNLIKYMWRYENKNGIEDLEKARFYLNMLIEREAK